MKCLVLGGGGMVAGDVCREAVRREWALEAPVRSVIDITDTEAVELALVGSAPDVVLNCAAYTDVDGCESRPDHAFAVNGEAVGRLAERVEKRGALLVHLSSDYVFDGEAHEPYDEDARTAPLSVYGRSKELGERLALEHGACVVRTSWLFGPRGPSFVSAIRDRLLAGERELRVVEDQTGCPTYTPYLARALCDLAEAGVSGLVHYRNREPVSWYGLAREIVRLWAPEAEVAPVSTKEFPRPAVRPKYSVLSVDRFERLGERRVELWRDGLLELRGDSEALDSR